MKRRELIITCTLLAVVALLLVGFSLFPAGIRMTSITALRPLFINGSGDITNASGTPDGTKFMRDDGVLAVPDSSGGGGLTTNGNQFLGVPLSIKSGAPLTNTVLFGDTLGVAGGTYGFGSNTTGMEFYLNRETTNTLQLTNVYSAPMMLHVGLNGTEFGYLGWVGNALWLGSSGARSVRFLVSGVPRWEVQGGSFYLGPSSDNLYDLGATATRVKNAYFGTGTVFVDGNVGYATALLAGVGGANTNYTLQANQGDRYINGFTNVSLRASMSYTAGRVYYWNVVVTNGGGTDMTLEFSQVTNNWNFAGRYGTNAPTTLTNNTKLVLSGRQDGTNIDLGYTYFKWP